MYDYEQKHIDMLRPLHPECTVLMRSSGCFPLSGPCDIALYGKGARYTVKGGTGSGDVNSRYFVTIEDGLKNAGFNITSDAWLDAYDEILGKVKQDFLEDMRNNTKLSERVALFINIEASMPEPVYDLPMDAEGDAAVYVLMRQPGEGGDRDPGKGDFQLTDCEIRDILYLQQNYKKFMLVLNAGGAVDLSPLQSVENILLLSQLGVDTGNALADILLGRANPSGKLASTWMSYEEIPDLISFGKRDDTEYREGIYVGYRYFGTAGKKPLFSFGHGLSFTSFAVGDTEVIDDGTRITVSADIMNTGSFAGKEVFQVYVSKPEGRLDQPYQELAAFKKTKELAPGETERVTASFDLRDISSFDEKNASYILEAGDYIVRTGNSSENTVPAAVLHLGQEITVRKVRNLEGGPGFEDWKPEIRRHEKLPDGIPVINISADCAVTETVKYGQKPAEEKTVSQMSLEELAMLSVGNFGKLGTLAFMIGAASLHVSGAAGESCGRIEGIEPLIMADGPAGLRLFRQFFRDKKGVHRVGYDSIMAMMSEYMPRIIVWLVSVVSPKPKKGQKIEDQYATAIPVGSAIAHSFNPDVAETCGDIVGEEMTRFGVHLWLAPALNIHRSILCGRNFEYYSEDPLLSGVMASAVTKGVQKHKGCGVTLKHFCANNQEYNRFRSNSCVSERALREIYLRGFERCIKESFPAAVMNSYNLLNGIHTSEREDLNTGVLRDEFGFDGLIMTDWTVMMKRMSDKDSVHRLLLPDMSAKAGSNVIMPGSKKDYKAVLKALRKGTLSRERAEANVSWLIKTIRKLTGGVS